MKFNILGFSQKGLVSLGLDTIDAMLLRYFIDFKATSKMLTEKVDGNTYFWVRYDAVLAELPILNIKKCTVQARFFKLRNAGVLTHYVKNQEAPTLFSASVINTNYLLKMKKLRLKLRS